jgi:acyl-CoA synthetase (AMP-forming)/AMP-acid ligase II
MPLFHIHGLMAAVLSSLATGASVVCTPGFQVDQFFEGLAIFKPTWYTAVPTMHQAVLNQVETRPELATESTLRFIRSSSSALPPQIMAGLERAFAAPMIEAYGMTEASHQMASNPLPPQARKPGTVGLAAGPEVAIMDLQGNLLPANQQGEIVIRGANVTSGYENNPSANESAYTAGWFRTGDQGRIDEEGYLSIIGRLKEMVNRGGEKIAPREIDEVFLDHPAVRQATAFAIPHPTLGEDLAVAVVLQEKNQVTEPELRQFAFSRLADYKVPSQVVIVKEIPKGPTGKPQRIGLAEKLADQLKREFVAPAGPVEEALATAWAELLNLEQVSGRDNFFALGGDSLKATQLVARLRLMFQVELPLETIFKEPILADQALVIEEMLLSEIEALAEADAQSIE